MQHKSGSATLMVALGVVASIGCSTLWAAAKGPSQVRYPDGTVVRKNADGTIDTWDAGAGSAPVKGGRQPKPASHSTASPARTSGTNSAPSSQVRVPSRVSHVGTRYINGVKIRTNADGTIESFDQPGPVRSTRQAGTAPQKSGRRTRSAIQHRQRTSHAQGGGGNYGDVIIRKNPDGTIESFDAH